MKVNLAEQLQRLPAAPTDAYPNGAPFITTLAHGSMIVEACALGMNADGIDRQQPHRQDELYFIQRGRGQLNIAGEVHDAAPGDAFFVQAGVVHRFENFSPDFAAWVVFYGPDGGEAAEARCAAV